MNLIITDAKYHRAWAAVARDLPQEPIQPKEGRPRLADRQALRGILHILETGTPWRNLPKKMHCGSGMSCLRRLRAWQDTGHWEQIRAAVIQALPEAADLDWHRLAAESRTTFFPRAKRGRTAESSRTVTHPRRGGVAMPKE